MINRKYFRKVWILLLLCGSVQGQTGKNPEWSAVREKVVLVTDRDIYFAGEELFFSATTYDGSGHKDQQISNVLYIELIGGNTHNPVLRGKYKITDFRVGNSLMIPEDISSGVYLLRAYTRYMQNFPVSDFANHFITILNPDNASTEGWINREERTPPQGLQKRLADPEYEVLTGLSGQSIGVSLKTTSPSESFLGQSYNLRLYTRNLSIAKESPIRFSRGEADHFYSMDDTEKGINYIVLTSPDGKPRTFRSFYIPETIYRKMEVETAKAVYQPGEKIQARFQVTGVPGCESAQVSVVLKGTTLADQDQIPENYLQDPLMVEAYLKIHPWLDPEEIENILTLHDREMDITHFTDSFPPSLLSVPEYIPEIRDLSISGILRDKKSKQPISEENVYVSVLFNNPQLHISKTNDKGEFTVSLNNLTGNNDIFITPETGKEDNQGKEILIKTPFAAGVPIKGIIPLVIYSDQKEVLEIMYANSQVHNKFITKPAEQITNRNLVNTFNIDAEKTTIRSEDFVRLENLREMFTEIVPNVSIRKNGDRFTLTVSDQTGNVLPGTPLVLLDRVPVFSINRLLDIPVSEIVKIEVINTTYILGMNSINGIVMIYSKNNNFGGLTFGDPGTFLEFQALEKSSNQNFNTSATQNHIPDFRTTLYWSPDVRMEGNRGLVDFTASDRRGEYIIHVKGFSADGTVFYGRKAIVIE